MVQFYKYTDKELDEILSTIEVLIDTREQENNHIVEYFKKQNIKYRQCTLKFGDYSFMIPANNELGIVRDLYFTDVITIERKGSLEELSGNFTKDRAMISFLKLLFIRNLLFFPVFFSVIIIWVFYFTFITFNFNISDIRKPVLIPNENNK